jgi:hypothetical protein
LPRFEEQPAAVGATSAAAAAAGAADTLLAELPGLEAHEAVQALLMEEIDCRVTCQGIEKRYSKNSPPQGPVATSLPVSIFVAAEHVGAGEEIIASLKTGDLIGEQWAEAPHPDEIRTDGQAEYELEPLPVEPGPSLDTLPNTARDVPVLGPEPQSTSARTVVLMILVALIVGLIFAFGRQ